MSAYRAGIALILAILVWLFFAPQSAGGSFSYAYVHGNSMAPTIRNGDAVLIRRAPFYGIGDTVAVRNPDLGVVLHRIVAYDGEHFTLQGDNRKTPDSYRATAADIVGKEWGHIPHAGFVLESLQKPVAAACVLGGLALLMLARGSLRRRSLGRGRPAMATQPSGPRTLALQSASGQAIASSLVLLVAVGGLLAAVRHVQTDRASITRTLAFSETGRFSYGDSVPGGVYDADLLKPPQPIYLQLTRRLPVTFEYELAPITQSETLSNVAGSMQLVAEVGHPNGWSKTLLQQTATFSSDTTAQTMGVVDLSQLLATIKTTEAQTGVTSLFYTLHIRVVAHTDGMFGGIPFSRDTEQAIEFRLIDKQIQLDVKASKLQANANVTVGRHETIPRTLTIPFVGYEVPYTRFPTIALGCAGVAAFGFVLIARSTLIVARRGPAARLQARHADLLVPADAAAVDFDGRLVGVNRPEDLMKMARRRGSEVLWMSIPGAERYLLVEGDVVYLSTMTSDIEEHAPGGAGDLAPRPLDFPGEGERPTREHVDPAPTRRSA